MGAAQAAQCKRCGDVLLLIPFRAEATWHQAVCCRTCDSVHLFPRARDINARSQETQEDDDGA